MKVVHPKQYLRRRSERRARGGVQGEECKENYDDGGDNDDDEAEKDD